MTTTQDPQASVPCKPNDKRRRKGRPGVARKPTEAPDKTRDIFAERCDGCGTLCSPNDQPNVHAWDHIPSVIFRKITNGFRSMGLRSLCRYRIGHRHRVSGLIEDNAVGCPTGDMLKAATAWWM